MKGGFGNLNVVYVYASMQQSVPGPLAGTGTHPLPAVTTFEKWDKQDGIHGLRCEITKGVDHRASALLSLMKRQLRPHPEAYALFSHLVLTAPIHWKTLATYLTDRRNICFQQCDDSEEAWLYPCEVAKGVFDECFKVRNVGSERSNVKELTLQDAARMMWGVLKCHQLMEDFIFQEFQGHPKLATYAIGHLFRNRLAPKSLETVKGQLAKMQRDIKDNTTLANKLKAKHGV